MGKKNKSKGQGNTGDPAASGAGAQSTPATAGAQGQQPAQATAQQAGPSQSGNVPSTSQAQGKQSQGAGQQRQPQQSGQEKQQKQQQQQQKEGKQADPQSQQQQGQQKQKQQGGKQKQKQQQGDSQPPEQWRQSKEQQQQGQQQKGGPQQSQWGQQQGKQQQQGERGPPQGQQQQRGPQQGQQQQGVSQQSQWGAPQAEQQKRGPQQGERGPPQQQRGPQQGQRGPRQEPQQQGGSQQGQWGALQGQQQKRGSQQGERGPPQQQRGPQQGQQQQSDPQKGQWRAPQGQQQQRGPQQGERGPPLQQGGQQQVQWGPPQQQGGQQQVQWGPSQQQQQQRGPQQSEWGPQEQQQRGPQQGERGPPQQQVQSAPPQQQGGQQQVQWGPPPQQQQQRGPQQSQGGPQEQQQRGPPQQQVQWAPPQQQGGQQQVQWGPSPQQQQQRGPQQGQWGPQEQQQQRGLQQGGQQGGQQRQQGPQQGQRGPQQGPQQRQQGPQQGQRGPQQGQQQQQQVPSVSSSPSTQSLRSTSVASTSSSSSLSSVSKGNIPRGTLGRPGTVEVNYLDINLDKMPAVAYHYDVAITPDRPKKFIRPAFEQFNRQFFSNIAMAFDGRANCYTVQQLPKALPFEAEVQLADNGPRQITFKIAIKETSDMEIDLKSLKSYFTERIYDKPMRALQCLEVVLANPCHEKGVRVGRSFFTKPKNHMDLDDGYEMWTGLYQAAILGDTPFLNVDISNKSFPSECNLIDYIQRNFRDCKLNQPLTQYNIQDLKEFLNSVNIVYEPPACFGSFPRTYKVLNVSDKSADKLMFQLEDGTQTSVAQYFSSKGYRLRYPDLNCLRVGSTVKVNYVPLELCKIPPGQATNKKDASRQVQKMIRYAATSTNVRKEKIMNMLQYFQHNVDSKIQTFGIRIGNAFKVVPMRLLKSPSVEYFSRELISPFKGAWRMNQNSKFLITKQINNGHQWAVIYYKKSRINFNTIQRFAGMVSDLSAKLNVSLAPKPEIIGFDNVTNILRDLRGKKYDLVFVVIPFRGVTYADIKQAAELKIGQLTQCIQETTIERRCDVQTVSNILLKVNGKLNGTNHRISPETNIPLKNVMFLGADVTHPSPDQKHIPSVVGVAASHDANGACYNMQYRLQRSTVENIEDMDSIFMQHMRVYFNYQGKYPDHIIYYRDGVSDGQFPIVKNNELRDIKAVCTKLRVSPKITCVVVVKRHHTRFFPQTVNPRDKFNNVEPGTVVDKLIVHPNEVEFFMVSHQSIQGTAKPTRYNVIWDDAKMNIDDLQKLTYNLCHMFPRCNRVVSYPAPAYLAHLVAFRGRVYIDGTREFKEPKKEYEKRLVNETFMQSNPMYFI